MLNLIAFIAVTLFAIAVILYYVFIVKPTQYEQDKAAHAKREAEEKLEAIDKLLSDALSEASMGGRR
jgi:nitrogen fixation-related uncharacterized protein